jgi:putative SOS response-associated peptidase YedK
MALAGIWEHWLHPTGSEILSVSLVTRPADETVGRIHHRMPVILPESSWASWLDTTAARPRMEAFLERLPEKSPLRTYPVSRKVNKVEAQGEELLQKVSENPSRKQLDLFSD